MLPVSGSSPIPSQFRHILFIWFKSLLAERVVSQWEYDQRATRVESTRRRYEAARDGANQRYRQWQSGTARVTLARKALGDTIVRAPFAGMVAERRVSVGDFVTTGTRVVTVVRVSPLRLALTVPEQLVARVAPGQPVGVRVDAYPGRTFAGTVEHVSPALRADQRALTVEAILPNETSELKPGLFASAEVSQPNSDAVSMLLPWLSVVLFQNKLLAATESPSTFLRELHGIEEEVVERDELITPAYAVAIIRKGIVD